jgi:hypothetical protein
MKDTDAEQDLLRKLKSGAIKAIDESLLPLHHLHFHNSRDEWANFCSTCRASKQRRRAARRDSGSLHREVELSLKPYGAEIWLYTLDYKSDQTAIGQFRYDLAAMDVGTGWTAFLPMRNQKTETVRHTLRRDRRHHEVLRKIVGDSANEIMQAAREEGADELSLVPYRPQANRLEREIETLGDHVKALLFHCRCIPHLRPYASRFASDMRNLFQDVVRQIGGGEGDTMLPPRLHLTTTGSSVCHRGPSLRFRPSGRW